MCVLSHSVVSDSSRPHGLRPTRLLRPWDFSRPEYWSGVLFQESGLTEIIPFICISAFLGKYPVSSRPELPQGLTTGSGCSLMAGRRQVLFCFLSALWAQEHTLKGWICFNDCDILLTGMAENPQLLLSLWQMILKFLY